MLAMMPATCGQGRQRNAGKNASAALAGPSKAKLPWSDAGTATKPLAMTRRQQQCHIPRRVTAAAGLGRHQFEMLAAMQGAMRAKTPAQQGGDTRATRGTTAA
jgi:hypothetical protein